MSIAYQLSFVRGTLPEDVTLVAVSKTHPAGAIREAYDAGHRIFGESRPQELREKYDVLPKDIEWHMIGHLQTNKVKYIAPFVSLIHSVDSARLAGTIQREAAKCGRTIEILLEIRVADEESKSGWELDDLMHYLRTAPFAQMPNICVQYRRRGGDTPRFQGTETLFRPVAAQFRGAVQHPVDGHVARLPHCRRVRLDDGARRVVDIRGERLFQTMMI